MNDENKEIKKNNIILTILTIIICILVGGGFFFWLGTLYAESGEMKDPVFETEKENDKEEKENKEEEKIKIDTDTAKKLVDSLVFIDFLGNYSTTEIKYENLAQEDIFYTIVAKIMVEKNFTEETFDNDEGDWSSNKQIIINLNSINEESKKIFGKVEYEYLPETFEYSLYYFEKNEDKYIGKPMITGFIAEPGYKYVLDNYELNKNEIIVVNVVGAYYQPGAGYFKNENEENIIVEESNWDSLESEIVKNKDKLNNLQYIFEYKDGDFIFKSIKMK